MLDPVGMAFFSINGSAADDDGEYYVGKNAKLFELVDGELVPIGFIELFAKYALETEDGSVLFPGYYHLDSDNIEEMVIDGLGVGRAAE